MMDELKYLAKQAEVSSKKIFKKNKRRLESMDLVVHDLHQKFSAQINCLDCANCCRALGPRISDKDIDKMAKALRIKPSDVVQRYLTKDEDYDFVFKAMPCPFLQKDNYCLIYDSRPKACREYPHTDRKKFYQIVELTIKNTYTCPIAYEVIEALKKSFTTETK